ncbi:protein lingerer [Biomphalaria pfeifferi]|uniref:Protein lingerer n=1 Tax=Biomphalaria pfeifferi TaxID=112525 RepID=A0AAD8BIH2_BIOPF|nr:protein lingerer [Biomphalaria pfeifferi]
MWDSTGEGFILGGGGLIVVKIASDILITVELTRSGCRKGGVSALSHPIAQTTLCSVKVVVSHSIYRLSRKFLSY